MSTVWFFGDSFVYGDGCKPWNEYYSKVDKPTPLWTTQIASYLECEERNLSKPGASNMEILRTFLRTFPDIQEDHTVYIQSTFATRLELILPRNKIINLELGISTNSDEISKGRKLSAIEFLHEWFLPNLNDWDTYWSALFETCLNLHKGKGLFIPYKKVVYQFETINNLFPDINDHHWSFKGHNQMTSFVLKNLDWKVY